MVNAVLFKSDERFSSFKSKLEAYDVNLTVLDFSEQDWVDYDYSNTDILIYYPSFKYLSSYPLALFHVYDNLTHIHLMYPKIRMYPDPGVIRFYNDKYKQYLFLKNRDYPIPLTFPLFSEASVEMASVDVPDEAW